MDRIQPPPNYYGVNYPNQDNNQTAPFPPQIGPYPGSMPPMEGKLSRQEGDQNIEEFYETFNKLVSSNLGKYVNVHCSFTDSTKWHDKVFSGVLASAGDNYIIVFNNQENRHYLIIGIYIDFIEFTDNIKIDGVMSK